MAYPESLTPDQQAALLAFMPVFRSNAVAFAKLTNDWNLLNNLWTNGGISNINSGLQTGDEIPDQTGLAGAQTLSSGDLTTFMAAVQSFLTTYNTPGYQAYLVRAIGPANTAAA